MRARLHPLAELYRRAERAYEEASRRLVVLEARLREVEARLEGLTGELAKRYGPGRVTVKSVRNRQGKKYRYVVWRTIEGRDIYLKTREAETIVELKAVLRELRREYSRYRRLLWAAKLYMKMTSEYKNTCIDSSGQYLYCEPENSDKT